MNASNDATIRLIFEGAGGAGVTVQVLVDELLVAVAGYADASRAASDVFQVARSGILPHATERLALTLDAATTAPTQEQVRAGLYVVQMIEPGDSLGDVATSLRATGWVNCVAFANELDAANIAHALSTHTDDESEVPSC